MRRKCLHLTIFALLGGLQKNGNRISVITHLTKAGLKKEVRRHRNVSYLTTGLLVWSLNTRVSTKRITNKWQQYSYDHQLNLNLQKRKIVKETRLLLGIKDLSLVGSKPKCELTSVKQTKINLQPTQCGVLTTLQNTRICFRKITK